MKDEKQKQVVVPGLELEMTLRGIHTVVVNTDGKAEVTHRIVPRKGLALLKPPSLTLRVADAIANLTLEIEEDVLNITVMDVSPSDRGVRFGKGCDFTGVTITGIAGGDLIITGEKQQKIAHINLLVKGEVDINVR